MQKVEKFSPEINKVYFIENRTLIHILSGKGSIQVDFKNYFDWQEKAIFLDKGQYIKFLSDDFIIRKIEFSNENKFYNNDVRVLFKHLISLGYIDLLECEECNTFLSETALAENSADIIDISSKQWFWQNPFKASKDEYQVIFDIKEIIDEEYVTNLTSNDLVSLINDRGYNAQALIKDKIGLTIKKMLSSKKLQESLKEVAFTNKNIQEISYELGYKDDAYFNRVFKNSVGQTPKQFRENFDFKNRDVFSQDILELLQKYHKHERWPCCRSLPPPLTLVINSSNVTQARLFRANSRKYLDLATRWRRRFAQHILVKAMTFDLRPLHKTPAVKA